MQGNPFNYTPKPPLPRNYSEDFNPADYECKSNIELESYARNLHNYLNSLLPQNPFPAFLFEKLEKRLDGITSILQKRCAASGALNKDKAKQRLQTLGSRLDSAVVPMPISTTRSAEDIAEERDLPPRKRARTDLCQDDIKRAMFEKRIQDGKNNGVQNNDEEEED